ncbi:hypothetical protein Tco_0633344 [Tanacetum coccineum]
MARFSWLIIACVHLRPVLLRGYGTATLEELLQVITWAQLGSHDKLAQYLMLVFIDTSAHHIIVSAPTAKLLLRKLESDGDKGKMIMVESEITPIADLRPTDCNKTIEPVVYRKWTSRHVYTRQPTNYNVTTPTLTYLNILRIYQQQADIQPILNIDPHRYEDVEEEKNRNRFSLVTLFEVNP